MDSVYTTADGRAAGVSDWTLFRSGVRRPTRGVRSTRELPAAGDVVARCREIHPVLPPTAVFSHATALDLLGIDRPRGLSEPDALHVLVPPTTVPPRRAGVVAHQSALLTARMSRVRGLPVLMPEEVWLRLAAELRTDEVVVLGDALLRRRRPWCDRELLARVTAQLPVRFRGVNRLRDAIPQLRSGTDSCQETRLRLRLVAAGLPCPEVNRSVVDPDGRFVALPDLSYPSHRLAVEYDGDLHRTEPSVWRRDEARRRSLSALGWRVIHATADDVRDPTELVHTVQNALHTSMRWQNLSPRSPGERQLLPSHTGRGAGGLGRAGPGCGGQGPYVGPPGAP